jgi:hypothetical protein
VATPIATGFLLRSLHGFWFSRCTAEMRHGFRLAQLRQERRQVARVEQRLIAELCRLQLATLDQLVQAGAADREKRSSAGRNAASGTRY